MLVKKNTGRDVFFFARAGTPLSWIFLASSLHDHWSDPANMTTTAQKGKSHTPWICFSFPADGPASAEKCTYFLVALGPFHLF